MLPPSSIMQRVACQPYANQKAAVPDWCKVNISRHSYLNASSSSLPSRVRAIVHQAE